MMLLELLARTIGRRVVKVTALVIVAAGFVCVNGAAYASEADIWDALRSGGHVALLRHALAPGTGDPVGLEIDDCNTQRNLSEQGRDQAARIGARLRANGIVAARVYSSQWCRCLDTAALLDVGPVRELPVLNSFFQRREYREPQTNAVRTWLDRQDLSAVHVLVTHQVNITALTGVYPGSGELVVVRVSEGGQLEAVGTIKTD